MQAIAGLLLLISGEAAPAMAAIAKVQGGLAGLQASVAEANAGFSLAGIIKAGGAVVAALAVAGAAVVGFGLESAKALVESGEAAYVMSVKYGIAKDKASEWVAAGTAVGVSAGAINIGFLLLSRRLETMKVQLETTGHVARGTLQPFKDLGINVFDAGGHLKSATEIMLELADAAHRMGPEVDQAAMFATVLGRGGAQLLPLLDEGRAGILAYMNQAKALGATLSIAQVDAAHKAFLAQQQLTLAWSGATSQLGAYFLPMLITVVNWFASRGIPALEHFVGFFKPLGDGIGNFLSKVGGGENVFAALGDVLHQNEGVMVPLGATFDSLRTSITSMIGSVVRIARAFGPEKDGLAGVWKLLYPSPLLDIVQALGKGLAGALRTLADNMNVVRPILLTLAAGLVAVKTAAFVSSLELKGFNLVMLATKAYGFVEFWVQFAVQTALARGAMVGVGAEAGTMSAAMKALGVSELFAAWPIALIVAGVALLIGGFILAYNHIQPFHDAVDRFVVLLRQGALVVLGALQNAFGQIANVVLPALRTAWAQLQPIIAQFQQQLAAVAPSSAQVSQALQIAGAVLKALGEILGALIGGSFQSFVAFLMVAIPTAIRVAVDLVRVFGDDFRLFADLVNHVVDIVSDILHGDWGKAWTDAKALLGDFGKDAIAIVQDLAITIGHLFEGLGQAVLASVGGFVNGALGFLAQVPGPVGEMAKKALDSMHQLATGVDVSAAETKAGLLDHTADMNTKAAKHYGLMREKILAELAKTKDPAKRHALETRMAVMGEFELAAKQAASLATQQAQGLRTQAHTATPTGDVWGALQVGLVASLKGIGGFFDGLGSTVHEKLTGLKNAVGGFFSGIGTSIHDKLMAAKAKAEAVWDQIKAAPALALKAITDLVGGFVNTVVGWFGWLYDHNYYFQRLVDGIRHLWTTAQKDAIRLWNAIVSWLVGAWNGILDRAKQFGTWLEGGFRLLWERVRLVVGAAWGAIQAVIRSLWNAISTWLGQRWEDLKALAKKAWDEVQSRILTPLQGLLAPLKQLWDNLTKAAKKGWQDFTDGVQSKVKGAVDAATGIGKQIEAFFVGKDGLVNKALDWGKNLILNLAKGIQAGIDWVQTAGGNVATALWKFLGFHSPTQEGPGRTADQWMPNLIKMMVGGLEQGRTPLRASLNSLLTAPHGLSANLGVAAFGGGGLRSIPALPLPNGGLAGSKSELTRDVLLRIERLLALIHGENGPVSGQTASLRLA